MDIVCRHQVSAHRKDTVAYFTLQQRHDEQTNKGHEGTAQPGHVTVVSLGQFSRANRSTNFSTELKTELTQLGLCATQATHSRVGVFGRPYVAEKGGYHGDIHGAQGQMTESKVRCVGHWQDAPAEELKSKVKSNSI